MLTRRDLIRLAAMTAASAPFLNPRAWAAATPPRRLVLIWSLATDNTMWRPKSAPGQPWALQPSNAPLMKAAQSILLVDGLSLPVVAGGEDHSNTQCFTGLGQSDSASADPEHKARGAVKQSVDQYILQKQPATTRTPFVHLGVNAKNESLFFNDKRLVTEDDPQSAFRTLFAGSSSPPTMGGADAAALPRKSILDHVTQEIKAMQSSLGQEARARLDQHLTALQQVEKNSMPVMTGGACMPKAPSVDGKNEMTSYQAGQAQLDLISQAFACDLTRVAGMQWGVSNSQKLSVPNAPGGGVIEEHGNAVHAPDDAKLVACESALCDALVEFIAKLQATPDPTGQGTLLDNTLIFWTRDMGQARAHTTFSIPSVLAGGAGYLQTAPGGTYVQLEGDDATRTLSKVRHDALLLNLCEWMGVTDYSGFGRATGAAAPLSQIKKS